MDYKPEQRLDVALQIFLCSNTNLNQDGIDKFSGTLSLLLNHVAINPVPKEDLQDIPMDLLALPEREAKGFVQGGGKDFSYHTDDQVLAYTEANVMRDRYAREHAPYPTLELVDTIARRNNLDGSMLVGHRHDYWRNFATDIVRADRAALTDLGKCDCCSDIRRAENDLGAYEHDVALERGDLSDSELPAGVVTRVMSERIKSVKHLDSGKEES